MDSRRKQELLKQGYIEDSIYEGHLWAPLKLGGKLYPRPAWMISRDRVHGLGGIGQREDYLGKAHHFREFCDHFFSDPNGLFHMEWNPNAVRIVDEFFANRFVSIMGCASSAKTWTLACIAVGAFLMDPKDTKVLVTSTTMDSARGKIWGDISYAWDQVEQVFKGWGIPSPGRKMASPVIRYEVDGIESYKAGIELIPTQNSSEKQSVEKVQGYKNASVIFIGDEWDTLPPGLVKTVRSNLTANKNSRCLAAFNPAGKFTPGGVISRPVGGWESIDLINCDRWETDYGICLRFDGEKSPNVLAGREIWKGLTTLTTLADYERIYGPNKPNEYWIMVRAIFPPTGELDCIYSQAEISQYQADHTVNSWVDEVKKTAGLDPSFTHGGDNAMLTFSEIGLARMNGSDKKVLERKRTINLDHYITDKTVSKDEQVVRLTKRFLDEENVKVEDLGVDITGAPSFGSLLNREIGTGWMAVNSSARPTNLPISKSDARKCVDVFDSLMSELWYVCRPLIREGQIKGLDADTIEEMCKRTYKGKGKNEDRVVVESKKVMKQRTGKSPDRSDSFFISAHVARVKHGLSSTEKPKSNRPPQEETDLSRFFDANPHLLQKTKAQKMARRATYEPLETTQGSW